MAFLARHAHTPIGAVEEMEWDRFAAYTVSITRLLKAENTPPTKGKRRR